MSERLKELAVQAGMEWDTHTWCWLANPPHLERFAELVRQDEREACAKLCDEEKLLAYHFEAKYLPHGNNDILRIAEGASRCAHLIRARGNHEHCAAIELANSEHRFDMPESHIVKWSMRVDPNNFGALLAKPEHEPVGQFVGGIPEVSQQREWVGLTDGEIQYILDCGRGESIAIQKAQQLLKDKNT